MIRQIKRSCAEQSRGSEQIVRTVTDIQSASAVNMEVTDFLALLQSELYKFVVDSRMPATTSETYYDW